MPFDPHHLEAEINNKDDYTKYVATASDGEWNAYVDALVDHMVSGLYHGVGGADVSFAGVYAFRQNYRANFVTILKDFNFQVTPARRNYLFKTSKDMGIVAAINAGDGNFITPANLKVGHDCVKNRRPPKVVLEGGAPPPPPQPYCTEG